MRASCFAHVNIILNILYDDARAIAQPGEILCKHFYKRIDPHKSRFYMVMHIN